MAELLSQYPELLLDWDPSLNEGISPDQLTAGSHVVIQWHCHKCGRVWRSEVKARALSGSGCTCDRKERQSLALQRYAAAKNGSLAETRPDLAAQWHPTRNDGLTPHDVTGKSTFRAWWADGTGHIWQESVAARYRNPADALPKGVLIIGLNDLATKHPELVAEWNSAQNGALQPQDITAGSNRKVWWICRRGHEWQASVASRSAGRGCPHCRQERSTSFPEQAIFFYLKKLYPNAENRYYPEKYLELDIYLPDIKIGVEYDGAYYHESERKQKIDRRKDVRTAALGIQLLRVVETEGALPPDSENRIYCDPHCLEDTIHRVIRFICAQTGDSPDVSVDLKRNETAILEQYIKQEKENSVAAKATPELLREWHPDKNGKLKPEYIPYGSSKKLWWLCGTCGHAWQATAFNRINGSGCPVCTGNTVAHGINDLCTTHPDIIKQWHTARNGKKRPDQYSAGSGEKVWWKCPVCAYEWEASIANVTRGRGCPRCMGKVVKSDTSLSACAPQLAREWHPQKNGALTPDTIHARSDTKVWWLCERGHEWQATVSSRFRGNKCPFCGNKRLLQGYNDFATTHPDLAVEWDCEKNEKQPSEVFAGTNEKVWWLCPKQHSYRASVVNRTRGVGCPFCAGKRPIPGENDLAAKYPELAAQWHPSKNGSLSPDNVTPGSSRNVWWQCAVCGHEWQARIWSRVAGRGCPKCAGKVC